MTYSLWEIYLEDLIGFLGNISYYDPSPVKVKSNLVKIAEMSKKNDIPTVRKTNTNCEFKGKLWLDERRQDEYYATFFPGAVIKPKKFIKERDVAIGLQKTGVKDAILVGAYAFQCVLGAANFLSKYFKLIIPKDAVYDYSKEAYKAAIESYRELNAKILRTKDLEKILKNQ